MKESADDVGFPSESSFIPVENLALAFSRPLVMFECARPQRTSWHVSFVFRVVSKTLGKKI